MIGKVNIEKSFDNSKLFSKSLEPGDFKKFFTDEGVYLDKLVGIMEDKAKDGDEFTVTYTVTVRREATT